MESVSENVRNFLDTTEFLAALAINLPIQDTERYLSVLRNIGKPILFEIDLPNTNEYIGDDIVWKIIREMLTEWAWCLANSKKHPHHRSWGISLNKPLPPIYISSHYHPRKIPDGKMEWKIYDAETGEYEEQQSEG